MDERPRIEHTDPVTAARGVLVRLREYGAPSDYALRAVADAVLACADGVSEARYEMPRHMWADEGARQHVRERLRRQLAYDTADHGRLPTALPTEEIHYAMWRFFSGPDGYAEVHPDAVERGADYDLVIVTLWVPVRHPPTDRPAVADAGLL